MTGIHYIIDEKGKRVSVVIDLHEHGDVWEDFHDRMLVETRRSEPRETLAEVKQKLAAKRKPKRH
jgi:hypothetical protein